MCSAIDNSSFENYTVKLSAIFDNVFAGSNLGLYKTLATNLNELLGSDTDMEIFDTVNIMDIIERYEEYITEYYADKKYLFNQSDIEVDGEYPYGYTDVDYHISVEKIGTYFHNYEVTLYTQFKSDESDPTDTTIKFKLISNAADHSYHIKVDTDWRISDMKYMNPVYLYLLKLKINYAKILATEEFLANSYSVDTVTIEFTE
jgi:hypothetical protein